MDTTETNSSYERRNEYVCEKPGGPLGVSLKFIKSLRLFAYPFIIKADTKLEFQKGNQSLFVGLVYNFVHFIKHTVDRSPC